MEFPGVHPSHYNYVIESETVVIFSLFYVHTFSAKSVSYRLTKWPIMRQEMLSSAIIIIILLCLPYGYK